MLDLFDFGLCRVVTGLAGAVGPGEAGVVHQGLGLVDEGLHLELAGAADEVLLGEVGCLARHHGVFLELGGDFDGLRDVRTVQLGGRSDPLLLEDLSVFLGDIIARFVEASLNQGREPVERQLLLVCEVLQPYANITKPLQSSECLSCF